MQRSAMLAHGLDDADEYDKKYNLTECDHVASQHDLEQGVLFGVAGNPDEEAAVCPNQACAAQVAAKHAITAHGNTINIRFTIDLDGVRVSYALIHTFGAFS